MKPKEGLNQKLLALILEGLKSLNNDFFYSIHFAQNSKKMESFSVFLFLPTRTPFINLHIISKIKLTIITS